MTSPLASSAQHTQQIVDLDETSVDQVLPKADFHGLLSLRRISYPS